MKVLILAAGRGARLKPLTDHTPKPLTVVRGKTLLSHHLSRLEQTEFNQIVINVSWLKSKLIDYIKHYTNKAVSIEISDEGESALETGGGMLKALPLLDNAPFIAINSDVFTDFDFHSLSPLEEGKWAHLVLVENPAHNPEGDFSYENNQLKLKHHNSSTFTYSGIGIFHPDLFKGMPQDEAFSVTPLIKAAIAEKRVSAQLHTGKWSDVGTKERLNELNDKEC